jgi:hypothetical protein
MHSTHLAILVVARGRRSLWRGRVRRRCWLELHGRWPARGRRLHLLLRCRLRLLLLSLLGGTEVLKVHLLHDLQRGGRGGEGEGGSEGPGGTGGGVTLAWKAVALLCPSGRPLVPDEPAHWHAGFVPRTHNVMLQCNAMQCIRHGIACHAQCNAMPCLMHTRLQSTEGA